MHLLLLQQKKAINHLDFIKLKLKLWCVCVMELRHLKFNMSAPPPSLWMRTMSFSSSSALISPLHPSVLIIQDKHVPLRMSASF